MKTDELNNDQPTQALTFQVSTGMTAEGKNRLTSVAIPATLAEFQNSLPIMVAALKEGLFRKQTLPEILVVIAYCQAKGLNPFEGYVTGSEKLRCLIVTVALWLLYSVTFGSPVAVLTVLLNFSLASTTSTLYHSTSPLLKA